MRRRILSLVLAGALSFGALFGVAEPLVVNATELQSIETESLQEENAESNDSLYVQTKLTQIKPIETKSDSLIDAVFGNEDTATFAAEENSIMGLEKYDPRTDALEYVTPVKDQNPYGTCWSFGAIGAIESSMIKNGTVDNTVDLSEHHLAYFGSNIGIDKLGTSKDDYQNGYNYLDNGGNVDMVASALRRWHGVALESEYPYSEAGEGLIGYEDGQNDAYLLDGVYFVPAVGTVEDKKVAFKKLINDFGAVDIAYLSDWDMYNEIDGTTCINNGESRQYSNHEVTLVGWDDNYPKENFVKQPENNGAWLLKNSWAEDWGNDGGYFYISYEDNTFADEAAVFNVSNIRYDNNYFHDNAGGLSVLDYLGTTSYAEVFEIQNDSESLEAVMVGLPSDNVTYKIDIYRLNVSENGEVVTNPTDGELLLTQYDQSRLPGVYTCYLDENVVVNKGDVISVVISSAFEGEEFAIYYNCNQQLNAVFAGEAFAYDPEAGWVDEAASETFLSNNCINLLTNTVEAPSEEKENYTVVIKDETGKIIKTRTVKAGGYLVPLTAAVGYEYEYSYDLNQPVNSDLEITAVKKPVKYTISYNLDGGVNNSENPIVYTVESGEIELKPAKKEGYQFGGWYFDKEYEEEVTSIPAGLTRNISLYALFTGEHGLNILPNRSYIDQDEFITIKADEGEIYYTIDGTEPTTDSYKYEGSFQIDKDTTVKAITVIDGEVAASFERTYDYYRIRPVFSAEEVTVKVGETVTIDVIEGPTAPASDAEGWYVSGEDVVEKVSDGVFRGLRPGEELVYYSYIDHHGDNYWYPINVIVEPNEEFAIYPKVNGEDNSIWSETRIVITAPTGASIYYTTDGTKPTINSNYYEDPFFISGDTEVKAIYVLNGKTSKVISQKYTVKNICPVLNVSRLDLVVGQSAYVSIVEYPENCVDQFIYSVNYFDGMSVEFVNNNTVKVTATYAIEESMLGVSCVDENMNEHFTYIPVTISEPTKLYAFPSSEDGVCTYVEGSDIVLVAPVGAKIYYTLDGSEPTEDSELYRRPINLYGEAILNAIAVLDGEVIDSLVQQYIPRDLTIEVEENQIYLKPGESQKVVFTTLPEGIGAQDFNWSSSNEDVAYVENGVITALANGAADVYAVYALSEDVQLTVTISVFVTDEEYPMQIVVKDAYDEANITRVTVGQEIAIYGPKGADIYYTTDGSTPTRKSKLYTDAVCLKKTGTIKAIAVIDGETVASVERSFEVYRTSPLLSTDSMMLTVGESRRVEIVESPTYCPNPDEAYWFSEDENIATVENGVITAVSEGLACIYCTQAPGVDSYEDTAYIWVSVKSDGDGVGIRVYGTESEYYTGSAIKPSFAVYDENCILLEGRDYTVTYKNNVNVGTASAIFKLKNGRSGSVVYNFEIVPIEIGWISCYDTAFTSKDANKTDQFVLSYGDKKLVKGVDYEITSGKAGDEYFEVQGIGNFTGTRSVDVYVNPDLKKKTSILFAKAELEENDYEFDWSSKCPEVTKVTLGKKELESGIDYIVYYVDNFNAGTAKAVIVGCGDYTGKKEVKFKINKQKISEESFFLASEAVEYVKGGANPVVWSSAYSEGRDYKYTYKNCDKVGTGTVIVEGTGNYTGKVELSVEVIPANISWSEVIYATDKEVVVCDQYGSQLSNKDYELYYNEKEDVVVVQGIGNYEGYLQRRYLETSSGKSLSWAIVTSKSVDYEGKRLTAEKIADQISVRYFFDVLEYGKDYDIVVATSEVKCGEIVYYVIGKGEYSGYKRAGILAVAK